jgi:soluble P-type ATPase
MIPIQRPGRPPIEIDSLVIDFEGTLAQDGRVSPKSKDRMNLLARRLRILVCVQNDEEKVRMILRRVDAEILRSCEGESGRLKAELIEKLGKDRTAVLGNGADDAVLFEEAVLSLCIIGREGASAEALRKADVVFPSVVDALEFLLKPLRQKATLGR